MRFLRNAFLNFAMLWAAIQMLSVYDIKSHPFVTGFVLLTVNLLGFVEGRIRT